MFLLLLSLVLFTIRCFLSSSVSLEVKSLCSFSRAIARIFLLLRKIWAEILWQKYFFLLNWHKSLLVIKRKVATNVKYLHEILWLAFEIQIRLLFWIPIYCQVTVHVLDHFLLILKFSAFSCPLQMLLPALFTQDFILISFKSLISS